MPCFGRYLIILGKLNLLIIKIASVCFIRRMSDTSYCCFSLKFIKKPFFNAKNENCFYVGIGMEHVSTKLARYYYRSEFFKSYNTFSNDLSVGEAITLFFQLRVNIRFRARKLYC